MKVKFKKMLKKNSLYARGWNYSYRKAMYAFPKIENYKRKIKVQLSLFSYKLKCIDEIL